MKVMQQQKVAEEELQLKEAELAELQGEFDHKQNAVCPSTLCSTHSYTGLVCSACLSWR